MAWKVWTAILLLAGTMELSEAKTWEILSPDQGQTFAYGSERHRSWIKRGDHLGIVMEFTNDPYVDRVNIRQYDDFDFNFPQVKLGRDGKTFYYRPSGEAPVAVAEIHSGLLGSLVELLPSSNLVVRESHGLVRLVLAISN